MGGASNSLTGNIKAKAGSGAASLRTGAFTVSIPKDMAAQAAQAAKVMGITKAQLVKRALADMLEEIQDIADAERVMAAIKSGKTSTISLDELLQQNGL